MTVRCLVAALVLTMLLGALPTRPTVAQPASPGHGAANATGWEMVPSVTGESAGPCIAALQARPKPSAALVGESVTVELDLEITCGGNDEGAAHVALVLDGSGSMNGGPNSTLKATMVDWVRALDLAKRPDLQVAVIHYNTMARAVCSLTNQVARIVGCINRLPSFGSSRIDVGLFEGLRALRAGREGVDPPPPGFMLVISDGENTAGCASLRRQARDVKAAGVRLATVCVGPTCDVACMQSAASTPADAYAIPDFDALDTVLDQFERRTPLVWPYELQLELDLHDSVEWIEANPPLEPFAGAAAYDAAGHGASLRWPRPVSSDSAEIRLRVAAPGTYRPFEVTRATLRSGLESEVPSGVGYLMALSPGPVQP